jgi:enoyl-CoA hydratase/carnithine racemase
MNDRYAPYQRLVFDRPHPRVLRITMKSPLKMGAMDALLHREVSEIWRDVDEDTTVSAAIITGDGNNFSAGGDLIWSMACSIVASPLSVRPEAGLLGRVWPASYWLMFRSQPKMRNSLMAILKLASRQGITRRLFGRFCVAWLKQNII